MQRSEPKSNNARFEIRPASPEEAGLFYAQLSAEDERLGAIGHVRMDFGRSGNEFWHTWWPRGPEELNSPVFKSELQVSVAYEVWQKLYEQICLDYNEQLPKRLPLSQQKEFKTVRNMVIQETLQWMAEWQQYAEAMAEKPAAPETPERAAPTENTPTAFPEPENSGAPPVLENAGASADASRSDSTDLPPSEGEQPVYEPPQSDVQRRASGSTNDPPTVGEAVVRMLHHIP